MDTERVAVECYAGHAYPTEPRAFTFRGARRTVVRVERTWRTPGALWFRVLTDRNELFTLAYYDDEYAWVILSIHSTQEDQR
ncbi:MAG: hypothetical protein KGJ80_05190 [Chloroflexota bacterium]|nr:hypothetical protein [Chloroflexota bacterium]